MLRKCTWSLKFFGDIDEVVIPNKRDVRGMDSIDSST